MPPASGWPVNEDAWNDLLTAETYAEFTRSWPVYAHLNRALNDTLFEAYPDWPDIRILDLACGTGATAEAVLQRLGPRGELHCVDRAAAMVSLARTLLDDPRVTFEVRSAERLSASRAAPFHAIVCNAAFWHFHGSPLTDMARLLVPGGSLHFTVPATYVRGGSVEGHPLQAAVTRVLAEGHAELPGAIRELNPTQLDATAAMCDLEPGRWTPLTYRSTQGEFMALLRIPAMSDWMAPGLEPEAREALLDQAMTDLDPDEPVTVDWFVVSFRRRAGAAPKA